MPNSHLRLAKVRWLALVLIAAAAMAQSPPLFLALATRFPSAAPLRIYAGMRSEFVLTLTAPVAVNLRLRGDLFAATQTIAAPVAKDLSLEVHRIDAGGAGVQRFSFALTLPETRGPQKFVLRLRVRTDDESPWLPLPAVTLEAVAPTWRQALRGFAERIPSGRLEIRNELKVLFAPAEAALRAATEPSADGVRVWFADEQAVPSPAVESPGTAWVVFKSEVPDGMMVKLAPGCPPAILVDASSLAAIEHDPAAQALLERILATAESLVSLRSRDLP